MMMMNGNGNGLVQGRELNIEGERWLGGFIWSLLYDKHIPCHTRYLYIYVYIYICKAYIAPDYAMVKMLRDAISVVLGLDTLHAALF
jgi:hypothetical protein